MNINRDVKIVPIHVTPKRAVKLYELHFCSHKNVKNDKKNNLLSQKSIYQWMGFKALDPLFLQARARMLKSRHLLQVQNHGRFKGAQTTL